MVKSSATWALVLFVALILIISGMQGSFGRVMAVVFVPDRLVVWSANNGS